MIKAREGPLPLFGNNINKNKVDSKSQMLNEGCVEQLNLSCDKISLNTNCSNDVGGSYVPNLGSLAQL